MSAQSASSPGQLPPALLDLHVLAATTMTNDPTTTVKIRPHEKPLLGLAAPAADGPLPFVQAILHRGDVRYDIAGHGRAVARGKRHACITRNDGISSRDNVAHGLVTAKRRATPPGNVICLSLASEGRHCRSRGDNSNDAHAAGGSSSGEVARRDGLECKRMGFWSSLIESLGGPPPGGGDYYGRLLRLAAGETIAFSTVGKHVNMVGNHVTFGGQYLLAITTMGHLVLGDMQTMNAALARRFPRGTVRVFDRGYLDEEGGIVTSRGRYTQAGPTGAMECVKILSFTPAHGAPFTVFMVESAVPQVAQWCTG